MRELKFYRDHLFIPIEAQAEKNEGGKAGGVPDHLVEKMKAL
jgi:hypothetical protein